MPPPNDFLFVGMDSTSLTSYKLNIFSSEPESDRNQLQETWYREVVQELSQMASQFAVKYKDHHVLIEETLDVIQAGKEVASFCHDYDPLPDYPHNGYRNLLLKLIQFLKYLLSLKRKPSKETLDTITQVMSSLKTNGVLYLNRIREDNKKYGESFHEEKIASAIDFVQSLVQSETAFDLLFHPLVQRFDFQFVGNFLTTFAHYFIGFMAASNWFYSFASLVFSGIRNKIVKSYYRFLPLSTTLKVLGEANGFWQAKFFPFIAFGSWMFPWKKFPSVNQAIEVPCQTQWVLQVDSDAKDVKLIHKEKDFYDGKTVKCFILREDVKQKQSSQHENPLENKVMIYVHGGGFVTNSTGTCLSYLPSFCRKMPGLTIISVEVSLSPKVRFPTQVQETLDVILWLQDAVASEKLGFNPSSFIFCGDSCGAQILMSCLMIITDINRSGKHGKTVILPERFVALFPTFHAIPILNPSYLLSLKDLALFATTCVTMSVCYLPRLPGKIDPVVENLKVKDIKDNWAFRPKEEVKKIFVNYDWLYRHPYFSSFEFKNWDDLSSVELNLFLAQDDPLFDLGTILLPKWKGKKTLDVARGLKHAYFFFMAVSRTFFTQGRVRDQITRQEDILVSRVLGLS